jgi:hypothetical protein
MAKQGPVKNNFGFSHPIFTPSSAAPQSRILDVAANHASESAQWFAAESDASLGTISAKLFLTEPLAREGSGGSLLPRQADDGVETVRTADGIGIPEFLVDHFPRRTLDGWKP